MSEVYGVHEIPLGLQKKDFPIKTPGLRRVLIRRYDTCPDCSTVLKGGKCENCDFDMNEHQ